ncbi:MAG: GNAT family N-acetyltransferase [Chthoniobacterales bacterium]|nr:GNAT family N-acetyltransferase [Chthoniobacterales bacterium]
MFLFRELHLEDFAFNGQILEIIESALGKNYLTKEELLEDWLRSTDSQLLGVFSETRIIGIRGHYLLKEGQKRQNFEQRLSKLAHITLPQNLGFLAFSAVHPDFRGKGIGKHLLRMGMQWLFQQGCSCLAAVAWISNETPNSEILFQAAGFRMIAELPEWWREESMQRESQCPKCGMPPCKCNGRLYVKDNVT